MTDWINTAELLALHPGIPEDVRGWLLGACATRGKNKGWLLANAPNRYDYPERWAAWQYLVPNVQRMATWTLTFAVREGEPEGVAFMRIQESLERGHVQGLVCWTERPYRWFCIPSGMDPDVMNQRIARKFR